MCLTNGRDWLYQQWKRTHEIVVSTGCKKRCIIFEIVIKFVSHIFVYSSLIWGWFKFMHLYENFVYGVTVALFQNLTAIFGSSCMLSILCIPERLNRGVIKMTWNLAVYLNRPQINFKLVFCLRVIIYIDYKLVDAI